MIPILYNLSSNVINPEFTGLITTPMSPEFVFEDFRATPDAVKSIDNHIRFGTALEYDILDCRRDGFNLSSIEYSKIDCEDLSMVYSFFGVYCDEESDVTFSIESIARQRLWINGSLAALCCTKKEIGRDLFTFRLAKGMNSFCIEQHESLKFFITTIRITSFEYEHKNGRHSLIDGNFHYKKGDFAVAFTKNELYNGENFKFVCTPIDSVNINQSLPLLFVVKESVTGRELYRRECRFFEFIEINPADLNFTEVSFYSYADVTIYYPGEDGISFDYNVDLHLIPHSGYVKPTEEKANLLLKDYISENARTYINYMLENICHLEETNLFNFHIWRDFYDKLKMIENGVYDEYLYSPGTKVFPFYSDIDERFNHYCICIPKGFSKDKKYSLLINNMINPAPENRYAHYFERTDAFPDLIVADVQGNGMTTGSYIGDISTREAIENILENYPVDKNSVFMMGQSNGGFSTWVIAQKTPDMFAGIIPSTGFFNTNEVMNLSNMRVRFLTSDADPGHRHNTEGISQCPVKLNDFEVITYSKLMHNVFAQVQFNEALLKEFFATKNEAYPKEIHFCTHMNRYRKAYWLEIRSIQPETYQAEIHATIDNSNIYVEAKNITGFTVTVPPQVDKSTASIFCCNTEFPINGKTSVNIQMNGTNAIEVDRFDNEFHCYKGTGLIDVYLTPMRIVNCDIGNECYDDVASTVQTPRVNTYEGVTYVKYPIFSENEFECLEDTSLTKYSLVIIDDTAKNNSRLESVRQKLKIKTYHDRYEYNGNAITSNYCIMQVTESPWNPERSILHISTNNVELFKKHFFLRQMLLPSYVSSFHPFLNVSVLIFDGKNYKTVHDYGMDEVLLK